MNTGRPEMLYIYGLYPIDTSGTLSIVPGKPLIWNLKVLFCGTEDGKQITYVSFMRAFPE